MSIGEWIAVVGIAVALIEPILLSLAHKRKNAERDGYMKRQLEDIQKEIVKSFGYHREHFAHAQQTDIHQKSMDERLIDANMGKINQRIDGLEKLVETKIDALCDRVSDLTQMVKNGHGK